MGGLSALVVLETPESVALAASLAKAGYNVTLYTTFRPTKRRIMKEKEKTLRDSHKTYKDEKERFEQHMRLKRTPVKTVQERQEEQRYIKIEDNFENLAAWKEFFEYNKIFRIMNNKIQMKRRKPETNSKNGNGCGNVYWSRKSAGLEIKEFDLKKSTYKDSQDKVKKIVQSSKRSSTKAPKIKKHASAEDIYSEQIKLLKEKYIFRVACTIRHIENMSKEEGFRLVYVSIPYSELILDDVYKELLKQVRLAVGKSAYFVGLHGINNDRIKDIYIDADISVNRCSFGLMQMLSFPLTHEIVANSITLGTAHESHTLRKRRTEIKEAREERKDKNSKEKSESIQKKGFKDYDYDTIYDIFDTDSEAYSSEEDISDMVFKKVERRVRRERRKAEKVDQANSRNAKEKKAHENTDSSPDNKTTRQENKPKSKQVEANKRQAEANKRQVEANKRQVEANKRQVEASKRQSKTKGIRGIFYKKRDTHRHEEISEKSEKRYLFDGSDRTDIKPKPKELKESDNEFLERVTDQGNFNVTTPANELWIDRSLHRRYYNTNDRYFNRQGVKPYGKASQYGEQQYNPSVYEGSRTRSERRKKKNTRKYQYYAFYFADIQNAILPTTPTVLFHSTNSYFQKIIDETSKGQFRNSQLYKESSQLYRPQIISPQVMHLLNALMIPYNVAVKQIGFVGKFSWEQDEELLYVSGGAVYEILMLGDFKSKLLATIFWCFFNCGGWVLIYLQHLLNWIYQDVAQIYISCRYQNGNIGSEDLVIILGDYIKEAAKKEIEVPSLRALQQREVESIKNMEDMEELYYQHYAVPKQI